ncbi:MAG: DNA cytosine methyltransferase [Caulobacteraceae bacterium]|nr:DNA cytosine methyltransferase [Caulobacteraceae bacterium]
MRKIPVKQLNCCDLFCGAGGTSAGAESTGAARVRFAVNHWSVAVQTHAANFPDARHVNSRLDQVNPGECERIDLLFASPECTHHSRARGGRPTSDQQRSGAWDVMRWIEHHRPSWVVVENVVEFEQWGPIGDDGRPLVSKRGAFFRAWIAAIEAAGYRVDWRQLNAADFGAATSRNRLFVVARKGNRMPLFPEPTHTRYAGGELPGLGLPRWRAAAEVVDWSLPCPSIFNRKRPLAPKTIARIEAGLRRFVGPFQVQLRNNCDAEEMAKPVGTITAGGQHHGLALPFTVEVNHGGADSRTCDLREPIGTVSTHNGRGLAMPFIAGCGGRAGQSPERSVSTPVATITTKADSCLVMPFLLHYYGTSDVSPVGEPVDTITTRDRHGLAMASLVQTCRELQVVDVGFRMLQNHELSAAQGFRPDYVFCGSKADVTRQIGNSVSPPVAAAITQAILGA